jgi:hypothetical protein
MRSVPVIVFLLILLGRANASGGVYYVSPSGSHETPFASPETGATNIQSAVGLAGDGDRVVIAEGHYILTSQIEVADAMEIAAASSANVVVDGNGSTRCFLLNNVTSVLNRITITNGLASGGEGGGVFCNGNLPILTNCVITDCQANMGGGVRGTTVYASRIEGNSANILGGGAEAAILYSCVVAFNTAQNDGAGLDYSDAYNTLIYSNRVLTADGFGGGGTSFECKLVNCTIVNNYSSGDGGGIESGGDTLVLNSIVYGNVAAGSNPNFTGSVTFSNSCCPDTTHGVAGNITDAPSFIDETSENYRLLSVSAGINMGNNSFVTELTDLDGNNRIVGGTVDMGAYEFQGSSPDPFSIAGNWSDGSFVVNWPAEPGWQYRVLWAESLTNSFEYTSPWIDHPQKSYTDTLHSADDTGFYKVEAQLK